MNENIEFYPWHTEWQQAIKQFACKARMDFNSMLLLKYFNKRCNNTHCYSRYYALIEVYYKLIWMGYCYEKDGLLLPTGFFRTNSINIAEGLGISVRKVRESANMLKSFGLVEIIKVNYESNCYRVMPEALNKFINAVLS